MTAIRSTSRHPSWGDLLRRLDGELGAHTEARLTRHLNRCEACRVRMAQLERQSGEANRYIRRLPVADAGSEARREAARSAVRAAAARRSSAVRWRRGWAAAAAIAGLLVASLAVDPLRAWVLERLSLSSPQEQAHTASSATLPAAVVKAEGSVISFVPGTARFDLRVERAQTSGELLLQVRDVERATAQVTNGGNETTMVLPSGLRIENTPSSVASYRIILPASVNEVVVRIGEEEPRVLEVSTGMGSWSETVPLGIAPQP